MTFGGVVGAVVYLLHLGLTPELAILVITASAAAAERVYRRSGFPPAPGHVEPV